jgi:hypothetical protein
MGSADPDFFREKEIHGKIRVDERRQDGEGENHVQPHDPFDDALPCFAGDSFVRAYRHT